MTQRMSSAEFRKLPEVQPKARARFPRGTMNKTEAAYAAQLELRKRAGEIADYRFEALTLQLADRTTLTVDFLVIKPDGLIELHETKGGFMREDSWIKLKVAATLLPWFRFVLVRKSGTKATPIWSAQEVQP